MLYFCGIHFRSGMTRYLFCIAVLHYIVMLHACGQADMRLRLTSPGGLPYETTVRFLGGATTAFDSEYDALFLPGSRPETPKFATVSSDDRQLSINSLPALTGASVRVPIYLEVGQSGRYTLQWDIGSLPADVPVHLADHVAGITVDLRSQASYGFDAQIGQRTDRFVLHLHDRLTAAEALPSEPFWTLYAVPGGVDIRLLTTAPAELQAELRDLCGRMLSPAVPIQPGQTVHLPITAPGCYLLVLRNTTRTWTGRILSAP